MQGKIIKGIAGFYYVHVVDTGIFECKAKGIFRNRHIKPLVGDNVTIGAGSVVTKSIPSNVLALGNPCKVIREI